MKRAICDQCPWRTSNQGKRTEWGFYTKANLRRLWNGIMGRLDRLQPQSCHLSDASHPDHKAAGAPEGATPHECPGSVIIAIRETKVLERYIEEHGSVHGFRRYRSERRGLSREGALWWASRGMPMVGGPPIPEVEDDPAIAAPNYLAEKGRR